MALFVFEVIMALDLYDYQIEAVNKMKNGCILCGDVGSGKSRTALGYYFIKNGGELDPYKEMDNSKIKDLYIITTPRKRDTCEWDKDLAPFLMSTHEESNLYSNKVIVDSWNNIKKYVDVENAFFIFDEQRVIGSGAWVKAFLKITKANEWILLSATPGDTWSDYIPVFIANGFYKNRTEFLSRHAVYRKFGNFPKIVKYIETGRLVRYRNSILVTMNYKKPTVRHNEEVLVDYDRYLYKRVFKDRWDVYTDTPIENPSKLCYILRKVVNSDLTRREKVEDLMRVHDKAIIFYNFNYELDLLKSLDYPEGTKIAEWNGIKHEPIPKSDRWVYLVQYTAGAEGWNSTETDTIIFYSQNYSYRVMQQSSGRIDRLNTPYSDLFYYHIRSVAPIDLAINAAIKKKRNFNESIFLNPEPRRKNIAYNEEK